MRISLVSVIVLGLLAVPLSALTINSIVPGKSKQTQKLISKQPQEVIEWDARKLADLAMLKDDLKNAEEVIKAIEREIQNKLETDKLTNEDFEWLQKLEASEKRAKNRANTISHKIQKIENQIQHMKKPPVPE